MEHMSFSRLFMAVSLILIYVIQKLVGLAHQTSPTMNLKPLQHVDDMDMRHLAFEDQLQFVDSDDYMRHHPVKAAAAARAATSNNKYLDGVDDIQLDSISISYLSVSVLLFELNERQGCLESANYSVIRTFSAVNVGQMVLKIRGFKIGSPSTASDILRGRLYNIANSKHHAHNNQFNIQNKINTNNHNHHNNHQHHHHNHHNNYQAPSSSSQKLSNQQSHYHHLHGDVGDAGRIDHDKYDEQQGSVCQGYGFTIYDCEPFDLEPNREHKIRIAFNPDFTLTKTIVSLTIYTNMDEEFKFALVASIPRNLLASCNRLLPRPDWEPTMQLVLPTGMVIMVLVSILAAYMEAMLYLRSQQATSNQATMTQTVTQSNNHSGGSNHHERNHSCSNHSGDTCGKDRSNGNGRGAASSAISATISSQSTSSLQFNGLTSTSQANGNSNNKTNKSNKSNSSCTQKRRKNSSTVNSEKGQANGNNSNISSSNSKSSSLSSTGVSDKKTSSPYAPIFQNLTNVISSPPPPLPTFDNEFDPLEFKKLRGKRSTKKSNSLNGSVAGSDDVANPHSLAGTTCGPIGSGKGSKANGGVGKLNGLKLMSDDSISLNGERDNDLQAQLQQTTSSHRSNSQTNRKSNVAGLRDVFTSTSMSDEDSCLENKLYTNCVDNLVDHKNRNFHQQKQNLHQQQEQKRNQHHQTHNTNNNHNNIRQNQGQPVGAQLPIQPPSSTSSSSAISSASSSSPSSTSSSPPLSASSYGEYSLLGPGASFELPCLRVRSK